MRNKILFVFFALLIGSKSFGQVTVTSTRDTLDCTHTVDTLTAHLVGDNPTDAGITIDDQYSSVHPIGFTFNFYGNNYTQLLIGPNGTLCFDIANAGMYTSWVISAALLGNATVKNSICGPWCDIDVSPAPPSSGIITYSTTGTAPFRKYIVTFCKTHMFSCTTTWTSTQIILYETTNVIETHIATKPVCAGWNGGYAIVGVQNATGTAATVAPGRDYPSVYTCTNEAWRFTPNATLSSYAVASITYAPVPLASSLIYWYNTTTNTFLGTGTTMVVSPSSNTTYAAGALGCADTSFGYKFIVATGGIPATYTLDAPITVCGNLTSITVGGLTPGLVDTIHYTYNGVPQPIIIGTVSAAGTIVIPNVAAGSYTNIYASEGTCSSAPGTINIPPPPIDITAATQPPSVCGYSDARIILSGYAPNTNYNVGYTVGGTAVAATTYTSSATGNIIITGLLAGTYTNITSTGGPCPPNTVAGPLTILNPAPPTISVDSAVVKTCVGVPVQLHAYSSMPGVPEYYTWSPATDLNNPNIFNPIVTPTAAGNISYVVTGNPSPGVAECAMTATLTVHTIGDFTITTPMDTICLLIPRVSVPVTVIGSAEMTYVWTPSSGVATSTSMSPVITPNTPGILVYTATGSYAHCPDYVHTYTIRVDTPAIGLTVKDTICLGMSDVVDFSSAGGPGYHYLWSSNPTGVTFSNDTIPNPIFTPPAVGTYTLSAYVTSPANAAGCGATDVVDLLVLPNTMTVSPVDTSICLGQVVQATGTIGYSNIFSYQWLPTAGIANSNILNALITPDTSALYVVTASFHKCPDIHATLNLHVQPLPQVYVGGNRPMCQFDTVHLHAVVNPTWFGPYTYSWTPATSLDMTTGASAVFSGSVTTNVVVTVSTSAGCTGKDSANITIIPGNFASVAVDQGFCPHDSKIIPLASTAAGITSYHWYPPMYVSDSMSGAPTVSPITTQTYSIVATNANGCKDTVYWTATVYPDAVIEVGDSLTLYPGESYHINAMTNCTSFLWFPVAGLDNPFVSNPTATPDVSTRYIVTATTEHNCVSSDTLSIYVSDESLLAMPNAFVPGTGPNNSFKVILRGIASLNYFRVYNRWGNLMFETKNLSEGWDGSYKGEPQEMGVYVYDVQAVSSTGKIFHKTGNVTLLR